MSESKDAFFEKTLISRIRDPSIDSHNCVEKWEKVSPNCVEIYNVEHLPVALRSHKDHVRLFVNAEEEEENNIAPVLFIPTSSMERTLEDPKTTYSSKKKRLRILF